MGSGSANGWTTRLIAWADRRQRRHALLGFPYAVVKKYLDDEGAREAALITYYGFLSIFPLLLLGVTVLTRVLAAQPELKQRLIEATVPKALLDTVEQSAASVPTSTLAFVAGLVGLLFAGTGVVFSAYHTLNHLAGVPRRLRGGLVMRYVRVCVMVVVLLVGAFTVGAVTVVVTAVPRLPGTDRVVAALGTGAVVVAVLLFAARLLLDRPAPVRAVWPAAALGAAAVIVVLSFGPPVLAQLVTRAGPVYGSFATVAGLFTVLYLVSQALVFAAEVAAVRYGRLWPRAVVMDDPTTADARALTLLAREREVIAAERVAVLVEPDPRDDGRQ